MMSKRKKIFLATGIIAGLALSVIFFLLWRGGRSSTADQKPIGPEAGLEASSGVSAPAVSTNRNIDLFGQAPVREANSALLTQIATIFVERFNSYSNQNNNSHLQDAVALSTDRMANWIKTQIVEQGIEYQGVVTQVYAANAAELFAERAVINISAQVTSLIREGSSSEFRNGVVDLVKVNEEWKVDKFVWID